MTNRLPFIFMVIAEFLAVIGAIVAVLAGDWTRGGVMFLLLIWISLGKIEIILTEETDDA